MVFGGGPSGGDYVRRVEPHNGVSALSGGHSRETAVCEPRFLSDADSPSTLTWDIEPLSCEPRFLLFVCLSVCGILSEQPERTETPSDLLNRSDPPGLRLVGFAVFLSSPSGVPVAQSKTIVKL